jgi:fructosamine-3-kinase
VIARQVGVLINRPVHGVTPVGGGSICRAYCVTLADGAAVFAKMLDDPPPGIFAAEAAGLRWLGEAGAAPVPEVLAVTDEMLVLAWVAPGPPGRRGAEQLGLDLAGMHAAGAAGLGAAWPGYIGPLPLDNRADVDWPEFYATRRLLPYLRIAVDQGALTGEQARTIERVAERIRDLAGPAEPPSRIHGDLWSGNVHWGADGRAWLIDPAAHGGHRETDLAMLALFGSHQLERTVAAYHEAFPLADGWRDRVPLHQLHPLLVHAALFGGGYGARAAAAASRY